MLVVRIETTNGELKDVYLNGAQPLIGGTAEEVTAHIETQFNRAQEMLDETRQLLTQQGYDADLLVPRVNGRSLLSEVRGLMHDTCATANKTARLVTALIKRLRIERIGQVAYDNLPKEDKAVSDFLCGCHTRALLATRADACISMA